MPKKTTKNKGGRPKLNGSGAVCNVATRVTSAQIAKIDEYALQLGGLSRAGVLRAFLDAAPDDPTAWQPGTDLGGK